MVQLAQQRVVVQEPRRIYSHAAHCASEAVDVEGEMVGDPPLGDVDVVEARGTLLYAPPDIGLTCLRGRKRGCIGHRARVAAALFGKRHGRDSMEAHPVTARGTL